MTVRRSNRAGRVRQYESMPSGNRSASGSLSPRAVMLLVLCIGPVLLICLSFIFGVGVQAMGMVPVAKQGGVLGSISSAALTVMIAAVFCIPGYVLAVFWFAVKSRRFSDDVELLKRNAMQIPLVTLIMFWLPAVVIPNIDLGVRIQVAGLTVLIVLTVGYLWIALVRIVVRKL